jgi:hypothetical protein
MIQNEELFTKPLFWVAQAGFILTALSGLLLVFVYNRHGRKAKPLYYYLPIFIVSLGAGYLVGEPFLFPDDCLTSDARFAWSAAVGVMLTVFFFYALYGKPGHTAIWDRLVTNSTIIFGIGLVIGLAIMGFLGFRLALYRSTQMEERYIMLENKRIRIGPEIQRELARTLKLIKSDSITISKQTQEIKALQVESIRNQQELKELGQANRRLLIQMQNILQRVEYKQNKNDN